MYKFFFLFNIFIFNIIKADRSLDLAFLFDFGLPKELVNYSELEIDEVLDLSKSSKDRRAQYKEARIEARKREAEAEEKQRLVEEAVKAEAHIKAQEIRDIRLAAINREEAAKAAEIDKFLDEEQAEREKLLEQEELERRAAEWKKKAEKVMRERKESKKKAMEEKLANKETKEERIKIKADEENKKKERRKAIILNAIELTKLSKELELLGSKLYKIESLLKKFSVNFQQELQTLISTNKEKEDLSFEQELQDIISNNKEKKSLVEALKNFVEKQKNKIKSIENKINQLQK